tara:strand:+ start:697 stop:1266 length:570 start_codon:yes stop_codon:yes gene_type:complete
MKNKNTIIIFSLIAICLLVLNYDNISYLFTLKEGVDASSNDVIEAQKLTLENEITNLTGQLLTSDENVDETTQISFKNFLETNGQNDANGNSQTRKGILKQIALKNLQIKILNTNYNSIKSQIENTEKTYNENKNSTIYMVNYFSNSLLLADILKDIGLNLYDNINEIKSATGNSSGDIIDITNFGLNI